MQAVMVVFAGVVSPLGLSGAALGGDEVPSIKTTSPPCLATFFRVRSRRGVCAASRAISSSRQRRTVDSDTLFPPCHVGQALIVAQHGQDDHRDLPGRQDPPPGPDHFQVTSQQIGEVVDGA
ncbi:hypothetical protein [Streptomyces phytophilus]|uniref:hypothetical protein n=1 Tax=Streptomyces phytophilus TaxID=722715 RepID=UPI00286805C1|nr:hypothetical protein [Streptomyces phytophilus]